MRRSLAVGALGILVAACGGSTSDGAAQLAPSQSSQGGASQGGGTLSGGAAGQSSFPSAGAGGAAGAGASASASGGASPAGAGGAAGGAGSGAGAGGATGGAGAGGSALAYLGSFTVVFQSEVTTPSDQPGEGASIGVDTRLDLRMSSGALNGAFTPQFADTQKFAVSVSADALTISPIEIAGHEPSRVDEWDSLIFPLQADGSFVGTVTAKGIERISMDSALQTVPVTAVGTITRDQVAPSFGVDRVDLGGPPMALLPWDPIALKSSEGVDAATLLASSQIIVEQGTNVPLGYTIVSDIAPPQDFFAWAGDRGLSFYAKSWEPIENGAIALLVAAGIPDLAGNQSAAFKWTSAVVDVHPAIASHDFQGDVVEEATWGLATYLGGKSGADAHCETGSCVVLGPLYTGPCNGQPTGIAGRLSNTKLGGAIAVRYRVDSPGQNGSPPGTYPSVMNVVVASPTPTSQSTAVVLDATAYTDQGASAGDARFTTGWRTDLFPFDLGAPSELGFELSATPSPCGGGPFPVQNVTLYVGSVTVMP